MKYGIELTNICNLKCEMCPRHHIDMELGYMDKELWLNLLAMIPKKSTILPFWRGESTLHPNFREMFSLLGDHDVVLTTNGTHPEAVIDVMTYLNTVNVSIHNKKSYEGYLKIKEHANGTKVIASRVEGESEVVKVDRVYKRHTIDGIWGKVEGMSGIKKERCPKMDETVIAWDGKIGKCSHIWDLSASWLVCDTCSQWMGNGKTL